MTGIFAACSAEPEEVTTAGLVSTPAPEVGAASPDPVPAQSVAESAPAAGVLAAPGPSVWLADLPWTEVARRRDAGFTTVIIPTGGTEQNGPHMALGKHNVVVAHTAEQIALQAGNTLVAPVMEHVPEGDPFAMDGHLRWPGTLTVPPATWGAVLDSTVRSLANNGFTLVVIMGDSGSSQQTQADIAAGLNAEYGPQGVRVVHLDRYYSANGQVELLTAAGFDAATIGSHAGLRDTSEVLAIAPWLVDLSVAQPGQTPGTLDSVGVDGNPTLATAELGAQLLDAKIVAGLTQLREARGF